jgi:hypothetical protein
MGDISIGIPKNRLPVPTEGGSVRQGWLAAMPVSQGNGTAEEAGAWMAAKADAKHQQRQASLPGADDGGNAWVLDQTFEQTPGHHQESKTSNEREHSTYLRAKETVTVCLFPSPSHYNIVQRTCLIKVSQ